MLVKARFVLVGLFRNYSLAPRETFKKFFKTLTDKINFRYKNNSTAHKKIIAIKKLKTRLGRVLRDFENQKTKRKICLKSEDLDLLRVIKTIYLQSGLSAKELKIFNNAHKHIYSLHAPETECIAKGKLNKKYEFGNKVSIARCVGVNFVVAAKSFHGNPYDGHTLSETISEIEGITGVKVQKVFLDRGYRGNDFPDKGKIYTPYTKKKLDFEEKKFMKRRSAVEATISHLKRYFRMGRNFLKGKIGDLINPILASIGLNLRQILLRI